MSASPQPLARSEGGFLATLGMTWGTGMTGEWEGMTWALEWRWFCKVLGSAGKMLVAFIPHNEDSNGARLSSCRISTDLTRYQGNLQS